MNPNNGYYIVDDIHNDEADVELPPDTNLNGNVNDFKESELKDGGYPSPLSFQQCQKLRPNDQVDFRLDNGKFVKVVTKKNSGHYLTMVYENQDLYCAYGPPANQFHRLCKAGSVSHRKYHGASDYNKQDLIDVNPVHTSYPGWKLGEIIETDNESGQVKVEFSISTQSSQKFSYWVHLDNREEVNLEFFSTPPPPGGHVEQGMTVVFDVPPVRAPGGTSLSAPRNSVASITPTVTTMAQSVGMNNGYAHSRSIVQPYGHHSHHSHHSQHVTHVHGHVPHQHQQHYQHHHQQQHHQHMQAAAVAAANAASAAMVGYPGQAQLVSSSSHLSYQNGVSSPHSGAVTQTVAASPSVVTATIVDHRGAMGSTPSASSVLPQLNRAQSLVTPPMPTIVNANGTNVTGIASTLVNFKPYIAGTPAFGFERARSTPYPGQQHHYHQKHKEMQYDLSRYGSHITAQQTYRQNQRRNNAHSQRNNKDNNNNIGAIIATSASPAALAATTQPTAVQSPSPAALNQLLMYKQQPQQGQESQQNQQSPQQQQQQQGQRQEGQEQPPRKDNGNNGKSVKGNEDVGGSMSGLSATHGGVSPPSHQQAPVASQLPAFMIRKPRELQEINLCSKYMEYSKQRDDSKMVGGLTNYVSFVSTHTKKLAEKAGLFDNISNLTEEDIKTLFQFENNYFRYSLLNGQITFINLSLKKYVIFKFGTSYVDRGNRNIVINGSNSTGKSKRKNKNGNNNNNNNNQNNNNNNNHNIGGRSNRKNSGTGTITPLYGLGTVNTHHSRKQHWTLTNISSEKELIQFFTEELNRLNQLIHNNSGVTNNTAQINGDPSNNALQIKQNFEYNNSLFLNDLKRLLPKGIPYYSKKFDPKLQIDDSKIKYILVKIMAQADISAKKNENNNGNNGKHNNNNNNSSKNELNYKATYFKKMKFAMQISSNDLIGKLQASVQNAIKFAKEHPETPKTQVYIHCYKGCIYYEIVLYAELVNEKTGEIYKFGLPMVETGSGYVIKGILTSKMQMDNIGINYPNKRWLNNDQELEWWPAKMEDKYYSLVTVFEMKRKLINVRCFDNVMNTILNEFHQVYHRLVKKEIVKCVNRPTVASLEYLMNSKNEREMNERRGVFQNEIENDEMKEDCKMDVNNDNMNEINNEKKREESTMEQTKIDDKDDNENEKEMDINNNFFSDILIARYNSEITEREMDIVMNVCPVEGNIFEWHFNLWPRCNNNGNNGIDDNVSGYSPPIHGIITFDRDFPSTAPSVEIRTSGVVLSHSNIALVNNKCLISLDILDNWNGKGSMVDVILRIGDIFNEREADMIVKQLLFDKYVCECGHKYNHAYPSKNCEYFKDALSISQYECQVPIFVYNPLSDWNYYVLTQKGCNYGMIYFEAQILSTQLTQPNCSPLQLGWFVVEDDKDGVDTKLDGMAVSKGEFYVIFNQFDVDPKCNLYQVSSYIAHNSPNSGLQGIPLHPGFTVNDTVVCCVDFDNKKFSFYLNGQLLHKPPMPDTLFKPNGEAKMLKPFVATRQTYLKVNVSKLQVSITEIENDAMSLHQLVLNSDENDKKKRKTKEKMENENSIEMNNDCKIESSKEETKICVNKSWNILLFNDIHAGNGLGLFVASFLSIVDKARFGQVSKLGKQVIGGILSHNDSPEKIKSEIDLKREKQESDTKEKGESSAHA